MNEILRLSNITHIFKNSKTNINLEILKDVNFILNKGEIASIIGKSGSGKSTLLHIASSLLKPTSGNVVIMQRDVYNLKAYNMARLRNENIGFVFQSFNLIEELNNYENMILPIEIKGKQKKELKLRLNNFITELGIENILKCKPSQISGGERARVAILRAISAMPDIVFLDEPTGALDNENAKIIEDLIISLSSKLETTFVYVTHDREFAKRAKSQYEIRNKTLLKIC